MKNIERKDKMKKKGFTLIELLAVIVILAIIALIAVPVVMNIINRANESAFKDSAYGILKAGELFYTNELLEAEGMIEDKVFTFPNDIDGLEINGSKPTGGTMIVNTKGQISMAIINGKHCVTKGFEDDDVTISDDLENCGTSNGGGENAVKTLTDLVVEHTFTKVDGTAYDVPTVTVPACVTNKTECDAGTPVAVKVNANETYKFYVLNDDTTKNEVTLIMGRNLYSDSDAYNGNVAWINASDYGSTTIVKNDKGPLTALTALKERTAGWTNIPAYTYTLENDDDGKDGEYTYPNITGEEVTNVRARLPKYSEIYAINNSTSLSNSSWLYDNVYGTGDNNTYGYWTSTTYSTDSGLAWDVSASGGLYNCDVFGGGCDDGVRPVIILSK